MENKRLKLKIRATALIYFFASLRIIATALIYFFASLRIMKKNKGVIITFVLVFGVIFLLLLGSLFGFILLQLKQTAKKAAWDEALQVAEAGANYYRWCLNNEVEDQCELDKEYFDPEGNLVGQFSLEIIPNVSCGETIERRVYSEGWTDKFPQTKRKISALYARASVAKYAYLLNDNVWAGADREIRGLYHSNGGVRMDGENQSLVTSSKGEWICTSSFGCSPCPVSDGCYIQDSKCFCPGVFTTTENSKTDLFEFPVSSFDFDVITVNLAQMKGFAQENDTYLPPSVDIDPVAVGYHIKFQDDGSFEVWIITRFWSNWAYNLEEGWHYDYFRIRNEYLYDIYNFDYSCPVLFVEDNLFVEGKIKGKIAVASANLIDPNEETNVVLRNDIDYTTTDGSDGFVLIGEKNILISPDSPNQMELRGIFIAQKGHFGRNHYPNNFKEKLEIVGAVVSNGRVGTRWSSGGHIVSGYSKRENYFDSKLVYSPPPFTPYVTSGFKIIEWEEIE